MSNDQTSLNQDLLINFELTHAIGRTLDPEQTCNDLLALLLSRRNLTIGSVWLRSGAPANGNLDPAPSDNELVLLKAIPISRIERSRIDANHPAFAMDEHITVEAFYPNQTPVRVLERGVSTGRIALFRLGRIGYLRLFAADEERLSDRVVRQLETIIAKFAITLEACLSHQTLQSEVTRRETMQQALKASERRLRDFAATAADWFWETDAEGRFVYVSGSFESVSHIPITQIRGHTRDEVYKLLKTQMASEKNFRSILARREPFQNVEFEVRDSNQQRRILRVAGIPHFDANGAFAGYRGSGTDITAERESARDRERLEITLRHAQKMDAVGQLTGGIAHDFNNILASILGFGYLAEMLCHEKPEVFEVIGRYVDEINTAGNRGKELVSKLLTYSRGGRAEKIEVDVAEVIDETTRLIRPTFPASIGLELSLAPGIIALASPIELQQVIMNLCLNARDALDGHGHIRITLVGRSRVKDVCSACFSPIDGEFIAITISDNGPGIPPSQHPHIFEPFFSTKGVGGTGLGLSMVHGILHEHQGHILLRSDEAKGTAFDILLPPNGPIATAPPAPTPAQSGRF